MNLVWFLTIATIFSISLGEFGQYPFGTTSFSISITDLLLTVTLTLLLIWQIGIQKKLVYSKSIFLIMLFWLVGLISLAFSGNFSGIFYLLRFILYSCTFYLGFSLVKEKNVSFSNITRLITFVCLVVGFLGLVQLLIWPDLEFLSTLGYDPHKNRLASTILDPNFTGVLLNFGMVFALVNWLKTKNRYWLTITIFLLGCIVLTFSRSAWVMTFISILVVGIFSSRRIIYLMCISLILLFLFVPRFSERVLGVINFDASSSERIDSWKNGLVLFQNSPILGVGFNNIRSALESKNFFELNSADGGNSGAGVDSSFLFILATTGLTGFIIYISWLSYILKNLHIKREDTQNSGMLAILLGLIFSSQFINSLFYPPIMILLFLTTGALTAKNDAKSN